MKALALLLFLCAWPALAEGDENEKLGITVVVDPAIAMSVIITLFDPPTVRPGATVKVSGKTIALGDDPTVKISFVADPAAQKHDDVPPTVEATAKVNAKGDYSASVRVEAPGYYLVNVIAPDGKGTAQAPFVLLDPPDFPDDVEKSFVRLGAGLQKQIESLRAQVAGLPANPARLETEERLGKIETRMADWPGQAEKIKAAAEKLTELVKKYPETGPVLHGRLQALAEVVGKNKEEEAKIDQELAKSRAAGATCEKLDEVIEALKRFKAALSFVQDGLVEVAKVFELDVAAERFTAFVTPKSMEGNPAVELAIKGVSKAAATVIAGPGAMITEVASMAADVGTYLAEQNFAKYCEKLEGPMKATMHAEIKKGDTNWWTYDITLQGKLVLRYAKGAEPGAPVHVSGEFIGSATKLGVWEDALAVLYPTTKKTSTLLRKLVVPPGLPFLDGSALGSASPTAFNVSVEGEIVGDKLTLTLGEARSDLSDLVEAHVTYVLIGPMILAPIIVKYDLPFTKARKLLFRAMNDGPIELPVKVTTKSMTLAKALTRKRPGEGNVVDYTLDIKACNPGCK